MSLRQLEKICFTICLVCIVSGTVLSLAMIWLEVTEEEVIRKSWLTILVLFLASALTLSVSKTLGRHHGGSDDA
ncbi:hypothetical protein K2D_11740 [Planctomycetes bacterium K2D]|uniref:Uncharacterized protein n=1 Tax=Botrimarina mediterranea TaxID=2528022 RepID=A0A518K5D8_9BACT|nr:hypothetical protein Spa11_11910 [Botrimarina mediterranea]QDV77578.1 hypothetical protein K2D_11740 [Planctomycetes bacterium K2D]